MNLSDIIEQGRNSQYYNDFKNLEAEINAYRNKIQPMTDEQGNKFRHMAGAAAMTQKYNPFWVNTLGIAKEVDDYFIKRKDGLDSIGDLINNLRGAVVGQINKNIGRKSLYDLIYGKYIK